MLIMGSSFAMDVAKLNRYNEELQPQMAILAEQVMPAIEAEEKRLKTVKATDLDAIRLAILYHNASSLLFSKGVKGYAAKGLTLLQPLYESKTVEEELRPIITIYVGSITALQAAESINPVDKMMGVGKGFKFLDEAVDKYGKLFFLPAFVRSSVASAVPEFFKKEKVALADLNFLEQSYQSNPNFVPKDIMATVYLNLGNSYKKQKNIKQAIQYWTLSKQIDPKVRNGEASEMLDVFAD